jgi:uncharacterized membrane protein
MTIQPRYAVPLVLLSAVTGSFFLARGHRALRSGIALALRIVAAAPLVASGTLHLIMPQAFVALLPAPFPQQAWIIIATGIPELAGAVGLFFPATRRAASLSLAVLMIAIFPANVYIAGQNVHGLAMPGVPIRTAMQAAYILLLLIAGWGVPQRGSARQRALPS